MKMAAIWENMSSEQSTPDSQLDLVLDVFALDYYSWWHVQATPPNPPNRHNDKPKGGACACAFLILIWMNQTMTNKFFEFHSQFQGKIYAPQKWTLNPFKNTIRKQFI